MRRMRPSVFSLSLGKPHRHASPQYRAISPKFRSRTRPSSIASSVCRREAVTSIAVYRADCSGGNVLHCTQRERPSHFSCFGKALDGRPPGVSRMHVREVSDVETGRARGPIQKPKVPKILVPRRSRPLRPPLTAHCQNQFAGRRLEARLSTGLLWGC